jgi:cyclic dehypoxanthinyl futalosine synthase
VGGDEPGSCEILMQGGLNPKLRIDYFEDLFSDIQARYPQVHIHSLSATEILYIAHISRLSVPEALRRLREAGLASLPGAGAEILVDEVRNEIAFRKDTTEEWLGVHRAAHQLGMNTTATMMYGSVETMEQRVAHILRIREVQDEALAAGRFTAFISWSFQPDKTALAARREVRKASGFDYLRTVAVSRLLLDNIENFQASYVTQGPKIAQIALHYGLNDFGSTMMEENVVSAANTNFLMPIAEIERLIREAGFEPRRRNTKYDFVMRDT